ncbi:MAG: efflux RND transporter periplasmic adaptor subunit [Bacteroidetes bacterium]|nr:efflux RND transporter periplasmic adaptor subunit [Bacteroidota bacterium]
MRKIALQLSISAMIFLSACSTDSKKETPEKFQVISPLIMDTTYQNEYVAEINALQNVEIRTRIKGFIENIYVDEGQIVKQGQTLFTISSKQYEQDLLKAKAGLKSALADLKSTEIDLENTKKLLDKKIVSKTELDMLETKVDAAKAKVEEAQSDEAQAILNLSFTEIKAPFDGIINRIPNKTGSLVEEGTLLTVISNNKEVFAYFNVSEKDYLDYTLSKQQGKSKEVSLVLANGSLYNHKGLIETTESEFDKSTGNIAFRAKFPNPEQVLKHGSSGKILVKTELKNAMLIPQKSTFEVQENIYVFVVDKEGKVQQRKVTPSLRLLQLYVISSGLSPNERIIYEGVQKVKDGDNIMPETIMFSQIINP